MSDHCQSLKREVVCQKSEGPALVPRPRVMVHQARWDTCGKTAGSKQVALCSLHSASKADDPTKMGGIAPFASPLELPFFFFFSPASHGQTRLILGMGGSDLWPELKSVRAGEKLLPKNKPLHAEATCAVGCLASLSSCRPVHSVFLLRALMLMSLTVHSQQRLHGDLSLVC